MTKLDIATGALDSTFMPAPTKRFNGNVFRLLSSGSRFYVGGRFENYLGESGSANNIAKIDLGTGNLDTTFSPPAANGFDFNLNALAVSGSSLYVGGYFSTYRGVVGAAHNIAKLDLVTGALDTTFSPPASNGFDSPVRALAVAGASLYVGGDFTAYKGVASSANRIAKLDLVSGAL